MDSLDLGRAVGRLEGKVEALQVDVAEIKTMLQPRPRSKTKRIVAFVTAILGGIAGIVHAWK